VPMDHIYPIPQALSLDQILAMAAENTNDNRDGPEASKVKVPGQ